MNFVSLEFALFFGLVFVVYWQLSQRWQSVLLMFASWFFYAFWDWRFLSLILLSTIVDYVAGAGVHRADQASRKRFWLGVSLTVNLGILGYFKYANFFVASFVAAANSVGWYVSQPTMSIILPVGISFYTFQTLSYTLDIYYGRLKPTSSLINFATFVAFFPQLVAGPIVRAREFLFQLDEPRHFAWTRFEVGALRFIEGLFMKAFVADNLAIRLVDPVFAQPADFGAGALWLGMIGYTAQIYADFSGYSSMAIGSAAMLGFEIPENFRLPYLSRSFSEFWTRWHITMSRFFRDYVYIPLGGSRVSETRTRFNLAATTLISGLWHGAAWTFVAWGGLHGLYIMVAHRLRNSDIARSHWAGPIGWSVTLLGVMFAWILFRAQSFGDAWTFFRGLWGASGKAMPIDQWVVVALATVVGHHVVGWLAERNPVVATRTSIWARAAYYVLLTLLLYHGMPDQANPFIYFQF